MTKTAFGIGFGTFEQFDIKALMLMIFTCMSVEEKQFYNFINMIKDIFEKINSGEFNLIFKEKKWFKMKYEKERKFVKEVNEALKEEIIVSRIVILESGSERQELTYVMYEDRFKRQYQVYKKNGKYSKNEYIPKVDK